MGAVWNLWTAKEDDTLRMALGEQPFVAICRLFPHRTPAAIKQRINKTLRLSVITGVMSMNAVARELGYDHKQLVRAKKALGQHWQRFRGLRCKGSLYFITEDQRSELLTYLLQKPLNDRSGFCIGCRQRVKTLRGHGYCFKCWPARGTYPRR